MPKRGLLLPGVVMAMLVVAAVAALLAVDLASDDSRLTEPLASGGSVCIQGTGGLTQVESEAQAVQAAYASAKGLAVEIVHGCPPPTVLNGDPPRSDAELARLLTDNAVGIREPDQPSPHRLFVYVLPQEVYQSYFGQAPFVWAVAEMYCSGDNCGEVTKSLYLPSGAGKGTVSAALDSLAR